MSNWLPFGVRLKFLFLIFNFAWLYGCLCVMAFQQGRSNDGLLQFFISLAQRKSNKIYKFGKKNVLPYAWNFLIQSLYHYFYRIKKIGFSVCFLHITNILYSLEEK